MTNEKLSNDELIAALTEALRHEAGVVANVVAMLADVEERRLHLQLACSSMFELCTRRLGMSEGAAFRRIAAARLAKRFPQVLEALRQGRVHLSAVVAVREIMTGENADELLHSVAGKSKREIEALVAKLAPKPDAPAFIRRLPSPSPVVSSPVVSSPVVSSPVVSSPVVSSRASIPIGAQLTPLAEARHRVQFTASSELRRKLERAQSLMRHRNVGGDLAVVVERAMDLLIARLEKEKLAASPDTRVANANAKANANPNVNANARTDAKVVPTANGRASAKADQNANADANAERCSMSSPKPRHASPYVPARVRREVVERDEQQCTFVSPNGDRCAARDFLELDHEHPRALGGASDAANLRLLCRAHNQYAAERIFGREHIARAIHARRHGKRAPSAQTPLPIG